MYVKYCLLAQNTMEILIIKTLYQYVIYPFKQLVTWNNLYVGNVQWLQDNIREIVCILFVSDVWKSKCELKNFL